MNNLSEQLLSVLICEYLHLKSSPTKHQYIARLQPNCISHCTKQYKTPNINIFTDSEFCGLTWQWFAMERGDGNNFVLHLQIYWSVVQSCYVRVS